MLLLILLQPPPFLFLQNKATSQYYTKAGCYSCCKRSCYCDDSLEDFSFIQEALSFIKWRFIIEAGRIYKSYSGSLDVIRRGRGRRHRP